jgi:N-acetylglucosamine-6-sulfatase
MQRGGYRTAMLGKYLNGYRPAKNPPALGWNEWGVAGNGYPEFDYSLNEDGKPVHYGSAPKNYITDVVSRIAARFIVQSASTPFFIEVATFAPHAPYVPAPRDAYAFAKVRAPRTPAFAAAPAGGSPPWLSKLPPLSRSDIAAIDRDFRKRAQSVQAVDRMIGDLETPVAASGQVQNTYFVFSSDNGYHMGEHRLKPGKMTAFDTDIHVPLVVTGPGVVHGRTRNEVVENIDLCPTFAELAGVAIPATADGHTLVPLLRQEPIPAWRSLALVEHHGPLMQEADDPDRPLSAVAIPRPTEQSVRASGSMSNTTTECESTTTAPAIPMSCKIPSGR